MSSPGSSNPFPDAPAVDAHRVRYGWSKAPEVPKFQHSFVPPPTISTTKATAKREQLDKEIIEKRLEEERIQREKAMEEQSAKAATAVSIDSGAEAGDSEILQLQTQLTVPSEEDVDLEAVTAVEQAPVPSKEDEDEQTHEAPEQRRKTRRCLMFLAPLVVLAAVAIPLGVVFGRKSADQANNVVGAVVGIRGENHTDVPSMSPSAAPSKNGPFVLNRPEWPITWGVEEGSTNEPSVSTQSIFAMPNPTPSPTMKPVSSSPTAKPTTASPSKRPSLAPSTAEPSRSPSASPSTKSPSKSPSLRPTEDPTPSPTPPPTSTPPPTPLPTLPQMAEADVVDAFNAELSKHTFYIEGGTATGFGVTSTLSQGRCYDPLVQNLTVDDSKGTASHSVGLDFAGVGITCEYEWTAKGRFGIFPVDLSGDLTVHLEDNSNVDLDVVFHFPSGVTNKPDGATVTTCNPNVDFNIDLDIDGAPGWVNNFIDGPINLLFDVIEGPLMEVLCEAFSDGKLDKLLIDLYPALAKLAGVGSALFGE